MGLIKFIKGLFEDKGVDLIVGPKWKLLAIDGKSGLDPAPKWVITALNKHMAKYPEKPYNEVKHFVGKTFVYKVYFKTISQWRIDPIIWRKYKNKSSSRKSKPRKRRITSVRHSFVDYCKSCHRKRVFVENRAGHYHCKKCDWRDPADW